MDATLDTTIDLAIVSTIDSIREKHNSQKERSYEMLKNLVQVIKMKDQSTLQHSNRVFELTREWGSYMRRRFQWIEIDLEALELAALLHDVGKVGVLDEVLLKPASLTAEERTHLEQHSEIGYQLIRDYPAIESISQGVRHHHERWDGKGYPLGLKAERIPAFAQIIAIVDAFDAMTSDRPYREGREESLALKEIENEAGRQFGPEFAQAFVQFMHARNT